MWLLLHKLLVLQLLVERLLWPLALQIASRLLLQVELGLVKVRIANLVLLRLGEHCDGR